MRALKIGELVISDSGRIYEKITKETYGQSKDNEDLAVGIQEDACHYVSSKTTGICFRDELNAPWLDVAKLFRCYRHCQV